MYCIGVCTVALNATQPSDALGIFKPNAVRLDPNPTLFSDADEELLVVVSITFFVCELNHLDITIIYIPTSDMTWCF